jgi:hypothetical protein
VVVPGDTVTNTPSNNSNGPTMRLDRPGLRPLGGGSPPSESGRAKKVSVMQSIVFSCPQGDTGSSAVARAWFIEFCREREFLTMHRIQPSHSWPVDMVPRQTHLPIGCV